ncbi:MAG: J domain-containing protein, partial [Nitrospirota bacterium]
TLEAKKIRSDDLASAKEKLKLNTIASREEIEKSYRQQALLYHPDKNSGGPDTHEQFDRITKAYRMLLEYCDGDACSFNEGESAMDMIIVKARD